MAKTRAFRRLPVGAEIQPEGGVHFRVWAPGKKRVTVVLERSAQDGLQKDTSNDRAATRRKRAPRESRDACGSVALKAEAGGYFSGLVAEAGAGTRYRYRLDKDDQLYPDPASRFQPEGPHGPSQVVDPAAFEWTDQKWPGVALPGQVIYEMHIGTYTPEGTWKAAERELPELAALGVTVLEVMPVSDFAGRFGWGYDGVDLFAPTRVYGEPDDFRRFVDRAHAVGLGVILDVVYNHFGPDGNYLLSFSKDYVTDRYEGEWGDPINFDGDNAEPVREFFIANAGYWIDEFHLDGLRLDATQSIHDRSPRHVLAEITQRTREAAGKRSVIVVGENEPQDARLVRRPDQGGYGLDALWNDDFHHTVMVAVTGRNEAYYQDYGGTPQELISAVKWGFLYQGQRYAWQGKRRGSPALDLASPAFITYFQNHDQVANSLRGLRVHQLTSPGRYRAMTALLLLGPETPMLFQGQEFAASAPFAYFADHRPELAAAVRRGRGEFLEQFPTIATPEADAVEKDPGEVGTFLRCKLNLGERERHRDTYALHRDLLRLRREESVFRAQRGDRMHGAVLGPEAFGLRFFAADTDPMADRLVLVNLGRDLHLPSIPDPLVAPPRGLAWSTAWSSEDPAYGGQGTPPIEADDGWYLPSHAAVVLAPIPSGGPKASERKG